jgi:hypothetical protein
VEGLSRGPAFNLENNGFVNTRGQKENSRMKRRRIIPVIAIIVLSFLSLSLAQQREGRKMRTLKWIIMAGFFLFMLWPVESAFAQAMEVDTDRPGMDYKNFNLPRNLPTLCEQACKEDPNCKAWTYVNPGVQGPNARCWLKSGVPSPVKNPCCVSGVIEFKLKPPVTPKAIEKPELRPLPPPIQVLFPSKSSSLKTGEIVIIKWKSDHKDVKNIAKFRIDLLDSNKTLIKELTHPMGISFSGNLSFYQYDRQIPFNIPSGKYMIKISLISPHGIDGESGLFDIQSIPHLAGTKDEMLSKESIQGMLEPPNLVKVTNIQLVSLNPIFYAKKLATVEITAEITTDSQFKLGEFSSNPKDPINYAILKPKGKLVMKLFPAKNVSGYIEVVDYDLAHDNPFFLYPKNMVMNKGKNTIKFTIHVHPSMKNTLDFDGSWWGPLTLQGTYDNKKCKKEIDLRVQAYLNFENLKKDGWGLIPHTDVTTPRDEKEAKEGYLFFQFFDLNCN